MLSRRSLVFGAVGIATLMAIGKTTEALGGGVTILRPPGAQQTDSLWARCIKCERCIHICPLNAICIAKIEDGLINARTPKMDYRKGYCDFCSGHPKCAEVCPTDCFNDFDPNTDKIGVAVVDTEQCLLYHSSTQCSKRCMDGCYYEALYLDRNGLLNVDVEKCNGCGACEYLCPSATYQVYRGSLNRGINVQA